MRTKNMRSKQASKGFTLLELLVAMAIFALLAFAGWQVFNSINRSKERADIQMDIVADLQYGYQQMQRDMVQVVDYKKPNTANGATEALPINAQDSGTQNPDAQSPDAQSLSEQGDSHTLESSFSLNNNRLSFIRHADPDPRYAQSVNFERIVYLFSNGNLIRERYTTLAEDSNEKPLQSIIVQGVTNGRIQALLPEPSMIFPNQESASQPASLLPNADSTTATLPLALSLPRGIMVNFNTQLSNADTPIEWVYAISKPAPKTQGPTKEEDSGDEDEDNLPEE